MRYRFLILISFIVLISGCKPKPGVIPTQQEVINRKVEVTYQQAKDFCYKNGGRLEDWKERDGSSKTYCILKEGYGCDPVEYAKGACGAMQF